MPQEGFQQVFSLGECRLDLSRGLLLRSDEAVALRPKAFALLLHLAANAGRVVGKSELIEAVWPGVLVTEDSLTQAVRELRKALCDDHQALVKTIARRGYLLALPQAEEPTPAQSRPSVAVLRFTNEGQTSDEPVIDGFAEDIVNALARFRRVAVMARNTTFAFGSHAADDWQRLGQQLGVNYLVHGKARLQANSLGVSVGLLDASTCMVLWADTFTASGAGIFEIQQEISQKIVNRLVSRIDDANLTRVLARPPASLAAYELLVRGLARFRGYRHDDNLAAKSLFEQAAEKDPEYGLAHAYVALADLALGGYGEASAEVVAAAVERSSFAVALAPEEPRCHRVLALTRLHAREHEAAEYHLRRSLELNPYDADTMAQMGYLLTMRGKPFEALDWLDRATRINPVHPDWYHYDRSMALYSAGDYQGAILALSKLPVKTPWRLTRLAACHAQLDNGEAARRLVAEIRRTAPDYSPTEFGRSGIVFEHASDIEHMLEGIKKALDA